MKSHQLSISKSEHKKEPVAAPVIPPPSAPIDIPNDTPSEPIEKEKVSSKPKTLKEYTHLQILKGLGL